jgi:hypothetical protein
MGDAIAVQYAGSLLAHRMNSSNSKWSSVSKDVLTSIRRYYTSTFTDVEKQCSINLFLGRFLPYAQVCRLPPGVGLCVCVCVCVCRSIRLWVVWWCMADDFAPCAQRTKLNYFFSWLVDTPSLFTGAICVVFFLTCRCATCRLFAPIPIIF